jgi:hypothetical protein
MVVLLEVFFFDLITEGLLATQTPPLPLVVTKRFCVDDDIQTKLPSW